ncbi:hypothetical protein HW555_006375 [Spodoptera exigua]|uniref:Uncharacterized protein n=1 Tax=Spodoptera exigua TaxID=7107 RepID=A0A835GF66_SPOEX|nr:hypothetical protein HW555_006375 [Spodoptera exigua]
MALTTFAGLEDVVALMGEKRMPVRYRHVACFKEIRLMKWMLVENAYARPNQPEAIVFPPIETLPEVPEAPKVPNTDGSGYLGLPGFLVDMSKILDRYIPTFGPNRDAKKQEEKKKTSDMMGNFFKYWVSIQNKPFL